MNLTSNTKYGKQVKEKYFNGFIDLVTYRELRDKYDDFLDSEIKLGDFVPTSLDGVVLEEPKEFSEYSLLPEYMKKFRIINQESCLKYQKALDRVLFENIDLINSPDSKISITGIISHKGVAIFAYDSDFKKWVGMNEFKTIEDLVKYSLTLSPNASKNFGL